jgi:hypothetical protein
LTNEGIAEDALSAETSSELLETGNYSRARLASSGLATLESVVTKYLRSASPAQRTREEYAKTLRKWSRWGGADPWGQLGRKEIREFLPAPNV